MTTFANPLVTIPRDHWQRPLVIPVGGGKPVAYTRCTTYVGCLEDTFFLSKWSQRMVAKGLSMRPDLLLAVAATDMDDKKKMDAIVDSAREAAAANSAATIGTAIHALTERVDRGQDVGIIPDAYKPHLVAYEKATQSLTAMLIEVFTVHDDLKIGGTPDRVVELDGSHYIADVKTGSIELGMGKIAMQLAVYARSAQYDPSNGQRTPLPKVSQDKAIVIHLPAAGVGACELLWVDIKRGWEGVQLATKVREWRAIRNLSEPLLATPRRKATEPETSEIANLVASAPSVDALTALWVAHQSTWTDQLTELARARRALIEGNAA